MSTRGAITPMTMGRTDNFVKRAYREGKPFQHVREALINAWPEADATSVHFDVDMGSFEALGCFRMNVEDNGFGITAEQLPALINTFGGGGKPIGDEHENFGVGFKSSVSIWTSVMIRSLVDAVITVAVLTYDELTGEIGLVALPTCDEWNIDSQTEYLDRLEFDVADIPSGWTWEGVDWLGGFPEWILSEGHGTVFTYIGKGERSMEDTYFGDPGVDAERKSRWAALWYLERRIWNIPAGIDIRYGTADAAPEKRALTRNALNKRLNRMRGNTARVVPPNAKHWELRKVHGLEACIYMVPKKAGQAPEDDSYEDFASVTTHGWVQKAEFDIGAANLPATCRIYYKNTPQLSASDYGWDPARVGCITALYKNEDYDITSHPARYGVFGIPFMEIGKWVWIVIEPKLSGSNGDDTGVYPGQSRSHLHWKGAGDRAAELPWTEWGEEVSSRMADEVPFLDAAISAFSPSASTKGDAVPKRVLEKATSNFLSRFKPFKRRPKFQQHKKGTIAADLQQPVDAEAETTGAGDQPGSGGGRRGGGNLPCNPSPGTNPGQFPGPNPKGNKNGNNVLQPVQKGVLKGKKITVQDDHLPEFVWGPFSTGDPAKTPPFPCFKDRLDGDMTQNPPVYPTPDLGATYVEKSNTIYCNTEQPIYNEVLDWWTVEFGAGTGVRAAVVEAVQAVYGTSVSTMVGHVEASRLDPHLRLRRLNDDTLTGIFYGLYDQHENIERAIKAILGRSAKRVGHTPPTAPKQTRKRHRVPTP